MNRFLMNCHNHLQEALVGWNRFWFTPTDPATLGLLRISAGAMLFDTHLVWTLRLNDFFGTTGLVTSAVVKVTRGSHFAWSFWNAIESPGLVWAVHIASLAVLALFTVGLWTRWTSILAFLVTVSYVNRVPITLFGLDQINGMLVLYLMLAPSGAAYSTDRLIQRRRAGQGGAPVPYSTSANIVTRLIQVHLCVVYFFAGTGKLFGESWWNGTALWLAFGNYEYQSVDMTWLAHWPWIINFMTHITLAWEISYAALIWPKWTRPIMLILAVPLHLGISITMGMFTFGMIMLIANLAFVSPSLVRRILGSDSDQAAENQQAHSRKTLPPKKPRGIKRV